MSRTPAFRSPLLVALAALVLATPGAFAAPLDLSLTFASLPSAQGFTYAASGSHASVLEASVFSVDGVQLSQNSIGLANGTTGGGILYQRLSGITTTETKRLLVRAACTATQSSVAAPSGEGGFVFGFATGSTQYGFGLTTTRVSVLTAAGTVLLSGTFDNTQFHDYAFDWSPGGSWQVRRDGVLIGSGTGGFALATNRVFLGDGTGGANASGSVRQFRFTQDLATAAAGSTWGRVKSLYR